MRKFMLCWILLLSLLLAACQPAGPGSSDPTVDATDPDTSCDHSYEETVIEPTQYDDGARVYTCIHCGHTYEKVLYATGSQGLQMHLLGNGTYAVNGIGSCTDTNVVIPAYYQGHMVTKIMGFGGDCGHEDHVYAHLQTAKDIVSQVLAQKVEEGQYDISHAKWIAEQLFLMNPYRVFRLEKAGVMLKK